MANINQSSGINNYYLGKTSFTLTNSTYSYTNSINLPFIPNFFIVGGITDGNTAGTSAMLPLTTQYVGATSTSPNNIPCSYDIILNIPSSPDFDSIGTGTYTVNYMAFC